MNFRNINNNRNKHNKNNFNKTINKILYYYIIMAGKGSVLKQVNKVARSELFYYLMLAATALQLY